jgi:putative two-component system response regulator
MSKGAMSPAELPEVAPLPGPLAESILVTDSQPEVLRLIDRTLGRRYSCDFASSVAEARDRLAEREFHLALCDVQMPSESGFVLMDEISARYPDTAIVLVTSVDDPEMAKRIFRLGAHGYLVKPFWPGQLLITTMNALRQRELEVAKRARSDILLESAKKQAEHVRDELALSQQQAIEELRSSRQETVEHLVRATETYDAETGRHIGRMASITPFLANQLGLDPEQVLLLRAAAPMHDVGKIATPDEIFRKKGPLTSKEREQMQRHTIVGHQILADSQSDLLQMAAQIALTHHERFDGSGYPQGLRGEDIPLKGRIVAVADAFDALLSDRCYRPAKTVAETVHEVEEGKETHFDPDIADILLEHLDEALSLRN